METQTETPVHDLRTALPRRRRQRMRHLEHGPGQHDGVAVGLALGVGAMALVWAIAANMAAWMNWG